MIHKPTSGSKWLIWTAETDIVSATYVSRNHTWHTWTLADGTTIKTNGLPSMFGSKTNACWWALEREILWCRMSRSDGHEALRRDAERVYKRCCEYHRAFCDQLAGKDKP